MTAHAALPPQRSRLAILPDDVLRYADRLTGAAERHYGAGLSGVYLHGSAAFGHFVAGSSDLDVLVVVAGGSDGAGFVEAVQATPRPTSALGVECSVLDETDLAATGSHRPFRLHLALSDTEERLVHGNGHPGDPDLVLHIAVCAVAGLALHGPPAPDTFTFPARAEILQTLRNELEWARDDGDWAYAVLNAARAWRYVDESVMCSKLDGWLWARARTAQQVLLDQALAGYLRPRADHRVPAQAMAGLVEEAGDLLTHVLGRLDAAPTVLD